MALSHAVFCRYFSRILARSSTRGFLFRVRYALMAWPKAEIRQRGAGPMR